MLSADYRADARNKLGGKWGERPWSTFALATLIFLAFSFVGGIIMKYVWPLPISQTLSDGTIVTSEEINPAISLPISLLVIGILNYSMSYIGLAVYKGQEIQVNDIFYGYRKFVRAFLCNLLVTIFVTLWSILFIIPGLIKFYSYRMTPYIMMEDENISVMDAITKSKEMMRGNKWRLFCLDFSFFGWFLLSAITLGILDIWVQPYHSTAIASFYKSVCPEEENKPFERNEEIIDVNYKEAE